MVPISVGYLLAVFFLIRGVLPTTGQLWDHATAGAIVAVAAMLLQDLVPKPIKEALVFARHKERLPGHRCFSPASLADSRIDRAAIAGVDTLSSLPPADQNNVWYRQYQLVSERPAIIHYSFRYLAWRDVATLAASLTLISIPLLLSIGGAAAWRQGVLLAAGCALLCILSIVAARAASKELITMVLMTMGHVQEIENE